MLLFVAIVFTVALAEGRGVHLGDLPMQNPDLFEGDIIGIESPEERNAIPFEQMKWPNGIVYYAVDATLSNQMGVIQAAMNNYHAKTCIRFKQRVMEPNFIRIFSGDGCYSNVGKVGGSQPLSLGVGCHFVGTVVHEFGHALGFYHEQNRSDRDNYIVIYWGNIQSGMESQFTKLQPHENSLLTPFDYASIMLYGEYAFSKDYRSKTMEDKFGKYKLEETYDKPGLSQSDIKRVNLLYKC